MEANRETEVSFSMKKGQAIGQLGNQHTLFSEFNIPIDLLQQDFEPQATNTHNAFVTPIFAINHPSMPMV